MYNIICNSDYRLLLGKCTCRQEERKFFLTLMTMKDPEDKESTSEESETQSEELTSEETEPSTPSSEDTTTSKEEVSMTDVMAELKSIKQQSKETIRALKDELKATKSELSQFKEETKSKEPVLVTCTVKGKYDYSEAIEKMGHKTMDDYIDHCRKVYDRINSQFHTINNFAAA